MSCPGHKPQVKSRRVGPARPVCDDERVPLDMTEGVVAASSPSPSASKGRWVAPRAGGYTWVFAPAPITTEGDEMKVSAPVKAPQRIAHKKRAEAAEKSKPAPLKSTRGAAPTHTPATHKG